MNRRSFPTWSLACGILSFVGFSVLTGVPAWILGHQALIDKQNLTPAEISQAQVGKVLGIIATLIGLVGFIVALALMGVFMELITIIERLAAGEF